MTEARLTEAQSYQLKLAAAHEFLCVPTAFAAKDPLDPVEALWKRNLLRIAGTRGDTTLYSITPAGRALLEGEGK